MRSKRILRILAVALALPLVLSAAKAWTGLEPELRTKGRIPLVRVQSTVPPATQTEPAPADADASSGATESADASGGSSDAVSAASEESAIHDAAYCLKCHGPFEALAERSKDYVTEWDEKANPHVFVPHETTTIVECAECHDPHPIPYAKVEGAREPNVSWCYSCHHAETLAHCNTCHNE